MLKNIVIINDFANADGGAGKVAIDVATALAEMYNVVFFTSVKPIDTRLLDSKIKLVCIGKPDVLNDRNRLRAITKGIYDNNVERLLTEELKVLNPDETIVHVHTWTKALTSAIFEVTAKMNFHLVLTLHDFFVSCANGGFFNYRTKRICELKSLSKECILTNCDARNYLQKIWRVLRLKVQNHYLWSNKKLTLLYISDMCKRQSMPYIPKSANLLFLPDPVDLGNNEKVKIENNNYYLYLGRLSPEKGACLFCDALRGLGLKGLLVGDGYIKNELEQQYPEMLFAGWATGERKVELMKKAKALIFPSFLGETYGLAVAEAKSYGIPCIVPDKCAASEQVEDGITGYVFKTGNLESLKEAILRYEHTDIKKMQQNLIDSFHPKDLSMETHLTKLVKIYNEILDDK